MKKQDLIMNEHAWSTPMKGKFIAHTLIQTAKWQEKKLEKHAHLLEFSSLSLTFLTDIDWMQGDLFVKRNNRWLDFRETQLYTNDGIGIIKGETTLKKYRLILIGQWLKVRANQIPHFNVPTLPHYSSHPPKRVFKFFLLNTGGNWLLLSCVSPDSSVYQGCIDRLLRCGVTSAGLTSG